MSKHHKHFRESDKTGMQRYFRSQRAFFAFQQRPNKLNQKLELCTMAVLKFAPWLEKNFWQWDLSKQLNSVTKPHTNGHLWLPPFFSFLLPIDPTWDCHRWPQDHRRRPIEIQLYWETLESKAWTKDPETSLNRFPTFASLDLVFPLVGPGGLWRLLVSQGSFPLLQLLKRDGCNSCFLCCWFLLYIMI